MFSERTHMIFHPLTRQPWIGLEGESGGEGGVQAPVADTPAPDPATTATPDLDKPSPDEQTEEITPKTFTQEELDAAISKRLGRERRKWDREQSTRTPEATRSTEPLTPDQFDTWEDYAEALSDQKAEAKDRARENQRQQSAIDSGYADRVEKALDKYDDFEQVAYNPNLKITAAMAETIKASDTGPDIAYYLGSNPKEAARIAELPPLQQAREIGKIEAKVIANPPVKKTSSAPDPITPVKGNASGQSFDTTDPRSTKTMSDSEWIAAERVRQINKQKTRAY
ncbi:MAG: hypothetical protein A3E79_06300 [Burkholderiales bacterium RIFCSPHIGHO2_12_FULL_61_11]|nr:MAG: hypothetical protein A3E79_06300 [Burkholderiales bacterium RIFCSPHIGHO2_12_FULL_61_11]